MLSGSLSRLVEVLNVVPNIVFCHERDGNVVFANRAAASANPNVRTSVRSVYELLPELRPVVEANLAKGKVRGTVTIPQAIASGTPAVTVTLIRRRPPLFCTVLGNGATALRNALQRRTGEHLDHSCISHEIGSLASAGALMTSLLCPQDDAEQRRLADLEHVLSRITMLAHSGTWDSLVGAQIAPVNLRRVVDEVLELQPGLSRIGAHILVNVSPECNALASRFGVLHIMLNLVSNARRALVEAHPKVLRISGGMNSEGAILAVSNTTASMPNANQLFVPHQPGAEKTGLGLYVSRRIARSYGGDLVFEPTQSECVFKLALPAAQSPANKNKSEDTCQEMRAG